MTPNEIRTLADAGESETVEFKKTTGERNEAAKTICAMLNHRGVASCSASRRTATWLVRT